MEPASAVAGLVGLAGLAIQTTAKIISICEAYKGAEENVDGAIESLQALKGLLQDTDHLANSEPFLRATTPLTRVRMGSLLTHCERDLEIWMQRLDNALPKEASKAKQRWKKLIVSFEKPKFSDLISRISLYTSQIDAMLGVMRGNLGANTNAAIVSMILSEGKYKYDAKKQLDAIHSGINSLQVSQNGFQQGTYSKLDAIGNSVSSIEINVQDLLYRAVHEIPKPTVAMTGYGHLMIPYVRNGNFVGRKLILEEVENRLGQRESNNRVAIYGLGGVGKSQIALEVAYRAQAANPSLSCFWVSAVSRTTFTQGFRQIATILGVPATENPNNDLLDLVKSWLQKQSTGPWLMVIDNVDDLGILNRKTTDNDVFDLLKSLPQCGHGRLLFTTRSKTWGSRLTGGGVVIQVPAMEPDEAQRLLQVKMDDSDNSMRQDCLKLVQALEYLPLPISHAASYISEMDITPSQYLRMFQDDKKRAKLLNHTWEDLARDESQANTVLTTWRISFEQIQRDYPNSADLLRIMGSLHWQDIPEYLLQQDDYEDELDLIEAVAPLLAFSLIQKTTKSKSYSMHRLIHIALRYWTQNLESERTAQKMVLGVFPILQVYEASQENYVRCHQLLPHAQKTLDLLAASDSFSVMSVRLKFRVAAYLNLSNELQQACDLLLTLVSPTKELADKGINEDFSEADLEDRITKILFSLGQATDGMERAKKAVSTRTKTLPKDDQAILRAEELFALGLIAQNRYTEAEKQLRATYSLALNRYGKKSVLTLTVLHSLAVSLQCQGQCKTAITTYEEILGTLLPIYGERNDFAIRCKTSIAYCLRWLYKIEEAGILIRKTLAVAGETLGVDHPLTLSTRLQYGFQLISEFSPNAAVSVFEDVWKGQQRIHGESAIPTLTTMGHLANALDTPEKSESLLKEALMRSEKTYGTQGPTRFLQDSLASLYFCHRLISFEELEIYDRSLLERRMTTPTPERSILKAKFYMVGVLTLKGDIDEALALCRAALERQIAILGTHHDDTWQSKNMLCSILSMYYRDIEEIETLCREQIEFLEETRGPNHCLTLDKKSYLGSYLGAYNPNGSAIANKSRIERGASMMEDAYNNLVERYGIDHRLTLQAASRWADYHVKAANLEEAKAITEKAIKASREVCGPESEETLQHECRLGWILGRQEKYEEGIQILERVYPLQKRLVSIRAPITACYWGICLWCLPGREKEGYHIIKTEGVDQWRAGWQNMGVGWILSLANIVKDDIFRKETDWAITDQDRNGINGDVETVLHFPHQLICDPSELPLRRTKSWHLETAIDREYPDIQYPGERESILESLRNGKTLDLDKPGWSCMECKQSIPYTSFLYRCHQKTCANGKFVVCESCHRLGHNCLNFEHLMTRTKAHLDCSLCLREIWTIYIWTCGQDRTDKDFTICESCHAKGTNKCPGAGHELESAVQPCYDTKDFYPIHCDECNRGIDITKNHWHCNICNNGDYDICLECRDKGIVCKDQSHVLVQQNRLGKLVNEPSAAADASADENRVQ